MRGRLWKEKGSSALFYQTEQGGWLRIHVRDGCAFTTRAGRASDVEPCYHVAGLLWEVISTIDQLEDLAGRWAKPTGGGSPACFPQGGVEDRRI